MTINSVFPVPIYEDKVDLELSNEEVEFLAMQSLGRIENSHKANGSFVGYNHNQNILELPFLKNLKDKINFHISKFVKEYGVNEDYWYIGKSWLTVTGAQGNIEMHNHIHHGGILSCVVYISATKDSGRLVFINPYPFRDRIPFCKQTDINKSFHKIEPETGKILIWPSSLNHGTEPNMTDQLRISISCDIFYASKNYGIPPSEIIEKINHGTT